MNPSPHPRPLSQRERGDTSSRRRWLTAALKLSIVALVLWFIRGRIIEWWDQLGQHRFHLEYGWLAASGGLYLLGSLLCGLFWHRTLRALGQEVSLGRALRAYYIGHLGKYVPGKAMVVILRAGLIRGPGVEASLAVVSVFFETLTMMSVGAMLGRGRCGRLGRRAAALALGGAGDDVRRRPAHAPPRGQTAGTDTHGRPAQPRRQRQTRKPRRRNRRHRLGVEHRRVGYTWIESVGGAPGVGRGEENPFPQLHLCTAAVALATVAGFLSFVPGGAVVREAVLAETLAADATCGGRDCPGRFRPPPPGVVAVGVGHFRYPIFGHL